MTRIVFQTTQVSVRGTEIALYDYARYSEEILGNESLVLYDEQSPLNNPDVVRCSRSASPSIGDRSTAS